MLFYVRRHTGADGSFEWYVLNGHTRRRASKLFRTRAAAAAARRKLQAKRDIAQAKVLQANAELAERRAVKRTALRRASTGERTGVSARKPGGGGNSLLLAPRN